MAALNAYGLPFLPPIGVKAVWDGYRRQPLVLLESLNFCPLCSASLTNAFYAAPLCSSIESSTANAFPLCTRVTCSAEPRSILPCFFCLHYSHRETNPHCHPASRARRDGRLIACTVACSCSHRRRALWRGARLLPISPIITILNHKPRHSALLFTPAAASRL